MNSKAQTTRAFMFASGALLIAICLVVFLDAFKNQRIGEEQLALLEYLVGGLLAFIALVSIYISHK